MTGQCSGPQENIGEQNIITPVHSIGEKLCRVLYAIAGTVDFILRMISTQERHDLTLFRLL